MRAIPRWNWILLWNILVWGHSDHEIWTLLMWSVLLDRCSPEFSGRDKKIQKVTNWSALVPEINSEWRNLWPFWLLHVASLQWKEWSVISVCVVLEPEIAAIWHKIDDPSLLQKCQFCMLAIPRWKRQSYCEKSWSVTTRTMRYGPYVCDQCLWIDALLHTLGETKNFRKSQIEVLWCPKSVQSGTICVPFDYCM